MRDDRPIDYDWLRGNGFHVLPRGDRQPTDHCRRCIGAETIDIEARMFVAPEDCCIDLAPDKWPDPTYWFCWLVKANASNAPPRVWVHVRSLVSRGDVLVLYRGLTGRENFA